MSDVAQELDEDIMDLIRNEIRQWIENPNEIDLTCVTIGLPDRTWRETLKW